MPWHIGQSQACPASKPYAVVKDSDGAIEGCHPTKATAKKQLAALYANEGAQKSMPPEENANERFRPPRDGLVRAVMAFPVPLDGGETYSTFEEQRAVRLRSEGEGGSAILFGHFTRYNEWAEIDSAFEGHFIERNAPGAFKKSFRERTPKVLFQHGMDPQIGDKPLGPVQELREDDEGPYYEVPLLDTSYNRDLEPALRLGLYGASYRFRVIRESIVDEPERSEANPDGLPERTIQEAQVMEFGPVTFPAYEGATAGIRSLTDEFIAARFASDSEVLRKLNNFIDRLDEPTQEPSERTEQEDTPVNGTTPGPRPTSSSGRWLTTNSTNERSRWL